MSLPVIESPVFELVQPSTGNKLRFRQFVAKEEKILLTGKESGEKTDIINAVKAVINNCILEDDFDVDTIPIFDMEYIFIQLRAKSVDNMIEFVVEDSEDGQDYELELNLEDVQVEFPEGHNKCIELPGGLYMNMKYPTPAISKEIEKMGDDINIGSLTFQIIEQCVESIYNDEEMYAWETESEKERKRFIDSIPSKPIRDIQKFFKTMPQINHVVEYTNSKNNKRRVVFRTLDDFFTVY